MKYCVIFLQNKEIIFHLRFGIFVKRILESRKIQYYFLDFGDFGIGGSESEDFRVSDFGIKDFEA